MAQQAKSKKYADQYRAVSPVYKPGDLVVIYRRRRGKQLTRKLLPRAKGPYQVRKRVSAECYKLEDLPSNRLSRTHRIFNVHVSLMKPYVARKDPDWPPQGSDDDDWMEEEDPQGAFEDEDSNEDDHFPDQEENVADGYEEDEGDFVEEAEEDDVSDEEETEDPLWWDQGDMDPPPIERQQLPPTRSGRIRFSTRNPQFLYEE